MTDIKHCRPDEIIDSIKQLATRCDKAIHLLDTIIATLKVNEKEFFINIGEESKRLTFINMIDGWINDRQYLDGTCTNVIKGEQCALPLGHEGTCKWGRGD